MTSGRLARVRGIRQRQRQAGVVEFTRQYDLPITGDFIGGNPLRIDLSRDREIKRFLPIDRMLVFPELEQIQGFN